MTKNSLDQNDFKNYGDDSGFEGGEFYWASRSSKEGTPETIVPPEEGRMTVFTSRCVVEIKIELCVVVC